MLMSCSRGSRSGPMARRRRSPAAARPSRCAAHDGQGEALVRNSRRCATARAERGADGDLAVAAFRADEEQVRDVRACDEQHDATVPSSTQSAVTDVADHVGGQRPHVRREARFRHHLSEMPAGEPLRRHRQQPVCRSAFACAIVTPGPQPAEPW
jgi:hypothetical protein